MRFGGKASINPPLTLISIEGDYRLNVTMLME